MSEYRIQSETLEAIGDAIREKTGGSALITPEDMADEIASISGGGGSGITKTTYTGTITLEDTNTGTITIPVDTSTASEVSLQLVLIETGSVDGGNVTIDDGYIYPHNGGGQLIFSYTASTAKRAVSVVARYKESVADETWVARGNGSYRYASYESRGSNIVVDIGESSEYPLKRNGIILNTFNGNRRFCYTGLHMKYEYTVEVWS